MKKFIGQIRYVKMLGLVVLTTSTFFLSGCSTKRLPNPQVIQRPDAAGREVQKTVLTFTPTCTASPTLTAAVFLPSETPVPTAAPVAIRYDVPVLSQEGLFLNGAPTGVGCVPVCIEMMTAWWNRTDPENPVLPAQEIIDKNADQGLYAAGRGMSSYAAADELAEIGYAHEMRLNSSKEELLEAFALHGPVGVLVKTNWVPTTMNHAAVLTGYDEVTDTVTLNDPFYGSEVKWTWYAFDGIWGLNYAGDRDYSGDVVRRVFFEIYPSDISQNQ